MVRECSPRAAGPMRSWLVRRSTMATLTPARANSPANISPVGPAPTITTACWIIPALRLPFQLVLVRPAIMGHAPGLAASPRVRCKFKVERRRPAEMGKIVVSDNVSLDGVVQDPAGD